MIDTWHEHSRADDQFDERVEAALARQREVEHSFEEIRSRSRAELVETGDVLVRRRSRPARTRAPSLRSAVADSTRPESRCRL